MITDVKNIGGSLSFTYSGYSGTRGLVEGGKRIPDRVSSNHVVLRMVDGVVWFDTYYICKDGTRVDTPITQRVDIMNPRAVAVAVHWGCCGNSLSSYVTLSQLVEQWLNSLTVET